MPTTSAPRLKGLHGHDFTPVAEALSGLAGQRVIYVPNPGNAGDSLIAAGTYQFFRAIGLDVVAGHHQATYPGETVIFGGGGNFTELYRPAAEFCVRNHEVVRQLVLLPHTVRGREEILGHLDGRVTLFGREASTMAHLEKAAPGARVAFCHDMALYTDVSALGAAGGFPSLSASPVTPAGLRAAGEFAVWHAKVARRRLLRGSPPPPQDGILNAFRTDSESAGAALPAENLDLSHMFTAASQEAWMTGHVVRAMIREMRRWRAVRTDRLHVAVLASLLGKPVEVWDNSYGKIGDVWRASLSVFPDLSYHPRAAAA